MTFNLNITSKKLFNSIYHSVTRFFSFYVCVKLFLFSNSILHMQIWVCYWSHSDLSVWKGGHYQGITFRKRSSWYTTIMTKEIFKPLSPTKYVPSSCKQRRDSISTKYSISRPESLPPLCSFGGKGAGDYPVSINTD